MDRILAPVSLTVLFIVLAALVIYIHVVRTRAEYDNRTVRKDSNFTFFSYYLLVYAVFTLCCLFLFCWRGSTGRMDGEDAVIFSYIDFLQLGILPFCAAFINIYRMVDNRRLLVFALGLSLAGMLSVLTAVFLPFRLMPAFLFRVFSFFCWILSTVFFIRRSHLELQLATPDHFYFQGRESNVLISLFVLMTTLSFFNVTAQGDRIVLFCLLSGLNSVAPLYMVVRILKVDFMRMEEVAPSSYKRLTDIALPRGYDNSPIHRRLVDLFKVEKVYLSPTLSLDDVAARLITNKSYLSKILNLDFKRNFRDLVNYYRIKEAVEIFEKNHDIPLRELYGMSGFKNNASFINAFKLNIGTTPSEWCKNVKNKNK